MPDVPRMLAFPKAAETLRRRTATLPALLALAVLLAVSLPAGAQQANDTTADHEGEPDLAGLLTATETMRMTTVEPGLSVGAAEYPPFGIRVHVFDFARDRFTLKLGEQRSETGSRAPDFFESADDVFVVNGGYFERSRRGKLSASGLLIVAGRAIAGEHDRAGSGVIYSGRDGVGIAYRQNFKHRSEVDHALQVGPILVDPGGVKGIYENVGGRFNRSALCLRGSSFTVVVVEGGMSLFQLADLLSLPGSNGGLGCEVAINLDGGPSTQATLRAGSTRLDIPGGSTVHNAVIVSRK